MHFVCRHIMPNGSRCNSPALRGKSFCYFHNRLHRLANAPVPKADEAFKLPVLEDRCAIQLAVSQVLDALGAARLDPRTARLYLYGIQLASQNVDRKGFVESLDPVESMTQARNGDMAPEQFICNTPSRCATCDFYDRCPLIPDEDEEEGEDEEEEQGDEEAETSGGESATG